MNATLTACWLAGGIIEGDIRINGHPKTQDTFARVSGYCEQTDVHVSSCCLLLSANLASLGSLLSWLPPFRLLISCWSLLAGYLCFLN